MKNNVKKFLLSFKYAFTGVFKTIKTEQNMKVHIFIMFLVIIFGIILKITFLEWIICVILFSLVIAGELFNTAVENVVDIVMPQINEKAKIAKDASAGGVLVLAIGAVIIGLIIFVPKILKFL